MKVYFTCGQTHVHQIGGGRVWDKDSLIEVEAKSYDDAVGFVMREFGGKYGSDYPETELEKLLPFAKKGIVAAFKVSE